MLPQVQKIENPPNYEVLSSVITNPKAAVWLNFGYYRVAPQQNSFIRTGGHWVTLVGCGFDREGKETPNVIVYNDPSPGTGREPRSEFVRFEPVRGGMLTGKYSGLPFRAAGFLRSVEGMRPRAGHDCAIIDGAVILELP